MAADGRIALGARGEDAACAWYRDASYRVLERNWRCAEGELDVVACSPDGEVIVFCEVKTRRSAGFGTPVEAVTAAKQRRVRRLAVRWLAGRGGRERFGRVRFDVVAVTLGDGGAPVVEVLEDAF